MSKFEVVLGVNGVAMGRHGLILRVNEAYSIQESVAHIPGSI